MNKLSSSWLRASSNSAVTRSNVSSNETLVNAKLSTPGNRAEVIEEYPDDKYSTSCLLLGFTENARPLHIQASLAETELVKIITIYDPNPNEWIDYRQRR